MSLRQNLVVLSSVALSQNGHVGFRILGFEAYAHSV